jgi:hypothetical protein
MAKNIQFDTIKLILDDDEAIGNTDADVYNKYLETLDESLLELTTEPMRFVMKKVFNIKEQDYLMNLQISIKDGKPVANLSYMLEELRYALLDIENPPHFKEWEKFIYKKEHDGYASKDLIARFASLKFHGQLHDAWQKAAKMQERQLEKKTS